MIIVGNDGEGALQVKEGDAQPVEKVQVDNEQSQPQWDQELFVEQIWFDLDGAASRAHIDRVTTEIVPAYENARVKIFVPILLRRAVVQRLEEELEVESSGQSGHGP